ncbi:MAG TPA: FAD-binding dehydrogenase [Rhodocyclaceae bacterium]|nr:FAD-binding dehydrogenase [Rhodocyclaceae bacterium]
MEQCDVLIVGGGIAGLCAALELIEADRSVILLERDLPQHLGGLAKESFGGMFLVDTPEQRRHGIKDTTERALADWRSFAEFAPDDRWPQAWAEAYVHRCRDDVGGWLRAGGVRYFPVPNWVERGEQGGRVQGNSVPRFHIVWGTGHGLIANLIERLEAHPRRRRLKILYRHRVERLLTRDRAVVGVAGCREDDGVEFEYCGGAVVVASGGINGSIERVRQNWHADWRTPPQTILNGSHRYADGLMHDAVSATGGRLTHLDRMWNYAAGVHWPKPHDPLYGASLVPPRSALWLNWRGERFMPPLVTGFDTRDLVARICAEERQYSWQLMNRRIALKELAVSGAEFNPSVRDKKLFGFLRDVVFGNRWLYDKMLKECKDFVVADSLPELVERMNALNGISGDGAVSLAAVRAAAERYDENLRGPADDEQIKKLAFMRTWKGDKIRTCKAQPILDPKAGPLIAVREFIMSRKSLGGIQTDLSSRALDEAGMPIAGLYAAGEAAGFGGGGMHGLRALEGTFLGSCVLSGRVAGQHAAGLRR